MDKGKSLCFILQNPLQNGQKLQQMDWSRRGVDQTLQDRCGRDGCGSPEGRKPQRLAGGGPPILRGDPVPLGAACLGTEDYSGQPGSAAQKKRSQVSKPSCA